jgi:predicted O-methyltransferase YrrM
MIEFGCHTGRTACRVLDNVPTISTYIGIDVPSTFMTTLSCQRTEVPQHAGHEASKHNGRFWLVECPVGSVALEAPDLEPADAIFIDGDHSEAGVVCDSLLARRLVKPGGIVVWHDYGNPAVEVTMALNRLHAEGWPIQRAAGTWLAFARY